MKRAVKFVALLVAVVLTGVCGTVAVTLAGVWRAVANADTPTCAQPVGYMLNVPTLPSWWLRTIAIRDAIGMVESASGQQYRFDGYTDWTPTADNIDQAPDDLVIDVDNPEALPVLLTGPYAGYTWWTDTHAVIALNALMLQGMPTGIDFAHPGPSIFTLTEHELGHSRGLEHSTDPHDVMNPNLTGGPFYSANDRAQLAATGCRP